MTRSLPNVPNGTTVAASRVLPAAAPDSKKLVGLQVSPGYLLRETIRKFIHIAVAAKYVDHLLIVASVADGWSIGSRASLGVARVRTPRLVCVASISLFAACASLASENLLAYTSPLAVP